MPFRVTDSGGKDFKKYGVRSGSRCKLKAWDLSDADKAMLQNNATPIGILQDMPKVLFIEMEEPLLEPDHRAKNQATRPNDKAKGQTTRPKARQSV